MRAFYDLNCCPPTFDVVAFLALAELERLKRGEPDLEIKILRGPKDGFRHDLLWPQDVSVRTHLLQEVVVPMCRLLPSASSVEVMPQNAPRPFGEFGAAQYLISLPAIMDALSKGCRPLRAPRKAAQWLLDKSEPNKLVTITLRESEHYPQRNSNTSVWMKVAQGLRKLGYLVVILRDTFATNPLPDYPSIPGLTCDHVASCHLVSRAALYSSAIMNLGINNGPMWFAFFLDVPVMMFKVTTNMGGCYDDTFYARYGLRRGMQLPTSPNYQRLVWEDDNDPNMILEKFKETVAVQHG